MWIFEDIEKFPGADTGVSLYFSSIIVSVFTQLKPLSM